MFPDAIVAAIRSSLDAAIAAGELGPVDVGIEVERPREREYGDWASNVSLAAAKGADKAPREVAEIILRYLPDVPHLADTEIAGPGFINFRLHDSWLHDVGRNAASDPSWGQVDVGGGEHVLVEYVSSNPTGPLHIGHLRGGVLGDALANLMTFTGFNVTREYYFNDAGGQMDRYAASFVARYAQASGEKSEVPEDGYQGEYLVGWAQEMFDAKGPDVAEPEAVAWGVERAMADIRQTLELAGIEFDSWVSEAQIHEKGEVGAALRAMRDQGHVYEQDGATWFRATEFGDEKDRVLVKADGAFTYVMPDIAYHWDKFERGNTTLINIWGADHHGYIPRVKAGIEAAGYDPDKLEVIVNQLVTLTRAGEPVKMSTRAGEFITAREVLEEVGSDGARYHLLAYSPDTAITFDLEEAKRQSMENPVYYLQYAHARMRSLERFAAAESQDRGDITDADFSLLTHPSELDLLRQIDRLGEEAAESARRRAPHRLCGYGYELAGAFHKFYSDVRIIGEQDGEAIPPEVTRARLWLVEAAKNTLVAILGILGISAPDEM